MKKQLILFSFVLFMGFVLCSAASAAQYADVAVNSIDCAVSSDGTTAEFSINIENKGTIAAQNVVLRDKMAGVDVSQSQYSINNGEWQNWNKNYINLGTITAGQTMLIEFKTPVTSNTLINKAELTTTTPEFNRYNNRLSYTTQATYTITSTAGTGGTINPDGNVNVVKGYDQTFTITPDTGYLINDILIDGISQGPINTYTFNNVQTNHTINANFKKITFTITPTAGTGGSISPNTPQTVNYGDNITFTITPNTGYAINDVLVDGISQGAITTYTFNNVQANQTIAATFSRITHTIIATTGQGGSITPSGSVNVNEGDSQSFTITADNGYWISDIVVDGVSQGPINALTSYTYTFNDVQDNHTISAIFGEYLIYLFKIQYGSAGGSLSPFILTAVPAGGDSVVYTITPSTGVKADLYLDNVIIESWVGPDSHTYQFTNVQSNHWLGAAFYYA